MCFNRRIILSQSTIMLQHIRDLLAWKAPPSSSSQQLACALTWCATQSDTTASSSSLLDVVGQQLRDPLLLRHDKEDALWTLLSQRVQRPEYVALCPGATLDCATFKERLVDVAWRQHHAAILSVHPVLWSHAAEIFHINVVVCSWDDAKQHYVVKQMFTSFSNEVIVIVHHQDLQYHVIMMTTSKHTIKKNDTTTSSPVYKPLILKHITAASLQKTILANKHNLDRFYENLNARSG